MVAIGGVAAGGLPVFDPLPGKSDAGARKTWGGIDGYVDIAIAAIDARLLVIM